MATLRVIFIRAATMGPTLRGRPYGLWRIPAAGAVLCATSAVAGFACAPITTRIFGAGAGDVAVAAGQLAVAVALTLVCVTVAVYGAAVGIAAAQERGR